MKITVFTGPVFRQDDKTYRGYRIPADYWKIVVFNKNNSTVSATGYIRTQRNLIDNQLTGFSYGDYKTYQVPISKISDITGINFNILTGSTLLTGKQTWDQKIHQITKLDQITL
jgi:endonuclease G